MHCHFRAAKVCRCTLSKRTFLLPGPGKHEPHPTNPRHAQFANPERGTPRLVEATGPARHVVQSPHLRQRRGLGGRCYEVNLYRVAFFLVCLHKKAQTYRELAPANADIFSICRPRTGLIKLPLPLLAAQVLKPVFSQGCHGPFPVLSQHPPVLHRPHQDTSSLSSARGCIPAA